jgi:tetratricopeptide (TPR) repeat protein
VLLLDVSRQGLENKNRINEDLQTLAASWNSIGAREEQVTGILATGPKQPSYDKADVKMGAFAYYLIDAPPALARPNEIDLRGVLDYLTRAVDKDGHKKQVPRMIARAPAGNISYTPQPNFRRVISWPLTPVLLAFAGSVPILPVAAQIQRAEQISRFQDALQSRSVLQPGGAFDQLRALDPAFRAPEYAESRQNLVDALERQGQVTLFWYLSGDEFALEPRDRKAKAFRGCEDAFFKAFEVARADEGERADLSARAAFCRGRALMYEYGDDAQKRAFLAGALTQLSDSAHKMPDAPEPRNALGIAELESGNFSAAQQYFEEAIGRARLWPFPRHNLALVLTEMGAYDAALKTYDAAIEIAPGNGYLRYNHAVLLQRLNRASDAKREYNRALQSFTKHIERLSGWLTESSQPDFPLAQLTQRTLRSYQAEVHNALGSLRDSREDHKHAVAEYQEALKIDPGLLIARHNLGLARMKQRKMQEAIACWSENVQSNPAFLPSRLELARAYSQKQPEDAIKQYHSILALQQPLGGAGAPVAAVARTYLELAKVRYCHADLRGAIEDVQQARKLHPDGASEAIFAGLEKEQRRASAGLGQLDHSPVWDCGRTRF